MSSGNRLHSWPGIFRGANGPISAQAIKISLLRSWSFAPTEIRPKFFNSLLGLPSRANQFNPPRPVIQAAFPCLHKAHFGTFSGDVSQKGYNG
jgi:hypothetical protein